MPPRPTRETHCLLRCMFFCFSLGIKHNKIVLLCHLLKCALARGVLSYTLFTSAQRPQQRQKAAKPLYKNRESTATASPTQSSTTVSGRSKRTTTTGPRSSTPALVGTRATASKPSSTPTGRGARSWGRKHPGKRHYRNKGMLAH